MEEFWARFVVLHLANLVFFLVSPSFTWILTELFPVWKLSACLTQVCFVSRYSLSYIPCVRFVILILFYFQCSESKCHWKPVWFMWIALQGGNTEDGGYVHKVSLVRAEGSVWMKRRGQVSWTSYWNNLECDCAFKGESGTLPLMHVLSPDLFLATLELTDLWYILLCGPESSTHCNMQKHKCATNSENNHVINTMHVLQDECFCGDVTELEKCLRPSICSIYALCCEVLQLMCRHTDKVVFWICSECVSLHVFYKEAVHWTFRHTVDHSSLYQF